MARVVHVNREPCDVYIGRGLRGYRASPWANPYRVTGPHEHDGRCRIEVYAPHGRSRGRDAWVDAGFSATRRDWVVDACLDRYKAYVLGQWGGPSPPLVTRLPELVGKRLGCWCAPGPCHGDVLVGLLVERGLDVLEPNPQGDLFA